MWGLLHQLAGDLLGAGDGWGKGWGKGGKGKGKDGWGGLWGKGFGKDGGKDKDGKGGKGKGAMRIAAGEQPVYGKIKTYDAEKQRGYIVCEEVFNMCGSDVYVFEKVLAPCGAGPGDTVAFFLHWSQSSGQPQASAPMIRIAAADSYALKGLYKSGGEGKDHGFLQCDITKEFFGRDVYVNKDTAATLEPGMTVAFNVYLNRDKMPNVDAQGAEQCDPVWEPTPGDISETRTDEAVAAMAKGLKGGKGKGFFMGKGKEGKGGEGKTKGKGGGGGGGVAPTSTGESFIGTIKSFNEANNYGFIACDEVAAQYGGVDVFFHGKQLNGCSVGEMVEFDVGLNQKGQPQAIGIRGEHSLSEDPAAKRPKLA